MTDALHTLSIGGWLLASTVLYVAAANLTWHVRGWTEGRGRQPGMLARRLTGTPLPVVGAFVYNLGIPYTALLLGRFDLRDAGLIGFDWSHSLSQGALLFAATAVILWLNSRHVRTFSAGGGQTDAGGSAIARLWHALFMQVHLAFYRTICVLLFGSYVGVWAALGLMLGEWLLAPAWRAGWALEAGQRSLSFDLALLLTTTVVFLSTGNTWMCLLVHAGLALLFPIAPYSANDARSMEPA